MATVADRDKSKEYRYFLYSASQEKMLIEVNNRVGKKYIPGEVWVNGNYKKYTQISKTSIDTMNGDAIIVAKGYLSDMKYTSSQSIWKVQAR